jgi:hypothetical protein
MTLIDLRDRDVDKWALRLVVERGARAFECRNCSHVAQVDVLELIEQFGADAIVGDIRRRARCRMCRSRRVRSLVRLKVGRAASAGILVLD